MTSSVETLDDNMIKLSVEVDEKTFDVAVDSAFKKIAREVRIPGFRHGRVPRKVLEARIGVSYARAEAMEESMGVYYAAAVRQEQVDVIGRPDIDITGGEEDGPLTFAATVETRPSVEISGYDNLTIEIPSPVIDDDDVQQQIDNIRGRSASLEDIERSATAGDFVTIDIEGTVDGEPLPGLNAEDYSYEVGTGVVGEELDENLEGASAGDVLDFSSDHPVQEDTVIDFHVDVKVVQEKVLPELTDEWVDENTDFETVDEMTSDITQRLVDAARTRASQALREEAAGAAGDLIDGDVSEALVDAEMTEQIQHLGYSLQAQGLAMEQWLAFNGKSQEEFAEDLREGSTKSARVDLALRAIATAEGLDPDDTDIDEEIERIAVQLGDKPAAVRQRLDESDGLMSVVADLKKRSALEWLTDHVAIVDDESGEPIERSLLDEPEVEPTDTSDDE
ncbi:MAG: trigger factor [Actinomycetia bacterium]|nr:trigger factor [Actinomycetes bacterium]MCP4958499.1 trigger factor [Actinomycetes bacterium]